MIAQILSAVLGVLAFAVLFHAPRRSYVACALCGGFSWGMFLAFTALGLSEFLASTLAIIALTLLARILSVALMMPATVFIATKKRTVLFYMFEPLIKSWDRALRE